MRLTPVEGVLIGMVLGNVLFVLYICLWWDRW